MDKEKINRIFGKLLDASSALESAKVGFAEVDYNEESKELYNLQREIEELQIKIFNKYEQYFK